MPDLDKLRELAAPDCPECGVPIIRLEQSWSRNPWNTDGVWILSAAIVCPAGHRTRLERIA